MKQELMSSLRELGILDMRNANPLGARTTVYKNFEVILNDEGIENLAFAVPRGTQTGQWTRGHYNLLGQMNYLLKVHGLGARGLDEWVDTAWQQGYDPEVPRFTGSGLMKYGGVR